MLRVLGKSTSINVRKVLWTCDELGLAPACEDWGSGHRDTQRPEFLRLNPNALVPVLVDGDVVLWESNTICRYLVARERRSDLLPPTPRERAQVEQWMDWQATELNTAWRYAFMARVRDSPAHRDGIEVERSIDAWNQRMRILDAQLERTGAYVCGPDFTLADVVLGLSTQRWYMTPMARPELPAVAAYFERLTTRAAFLRHGRNGLP